MASSPPVIADPATGRGSRAESKTLQAIRIQELEKELLECKKSYYDLHEERLRKHSPHVDEIEEFISNLVEELATATAAVLGGETSLLFMQGEQDYQQFLLEYDLEFDAYEEEAILEILEKEGESLFFEKIITQIITPSEYIAAKAALSAPPAVPSSKKTKSENKWAVEYRLKELSNKIQQYDLRERLRASPEGQAVIKKIIHDNTPKVLAIFRLPSRLEECHSKVEECEARAERYRKALHISVGISNAPAAALPTKAMNAPAAPSSTAAMNAMGEIVMIYGKFFWVQNGNVYKYNIATEQAGSFLGRLTPGGGINRTAAEVMKGGSRKTRNSRYRSSKNRKTKSKSRRH